MANVKLFDQTGKEVSSVELNDAIIGIEPNESVVFDVIISQRASLRQGTHAVKNRSAVSGGGRKPWRQKGTGRARQGTIRAPQFRGGGTVFGAVPRDYHYRVNKKVRNLALRSVLSEKVAETAFAVIDQFNVDAPKTKTFVGIMEAINAPKKTLFVVGKEEDANNAYLSSRNIPEAKMLRSDLINVFDLVKANKVVMTAAAVKEVEEALA